MYLGVLISSKKLANIHFDSMIDQVENLTKGWDHNHISPAGRTTLINSSIMSILLYYLSIYPIPDSILDQISKIARHFFWSKSGNRNGICTVSWDDVTLNKTEGGLSIRNLKFSKISFMSKNVFNYLNSTNLIWVDIVRLKYSKINF